MMVDENGLAALIPSARRNTTAPMLWAEDFRHDHADLTCAECPPGTAIHALWIGGLNHHLVMRCARCSRALCRVKVARNGGSNVQDL